MLTYAYFQIICDDTYAHMKMLVYVCVYFCLRIHIRMHVGVNARISAVRENGSYDLDLFCSMFKHTCIHARA